MNIKTITSTEGVNEVDFGSNASRFYWFQNIGTTTVHVSGKADITAGSDGVAELAAGDSVCIETLGGKVYVLGEGKVQIHNTGDKFCPFKIAPAQGGGEAVDAYTKTESDDKYAQKTDVVPYKMGMDYGTCVTAAATVVKTATTLHKVAPKIGAVFAVKFNNAVPAQARLNINGLTGYIQYRGGSIPNGVINAGDIATFIYHSSSGFNTFEILSVENGGNADTLDGRHASDFVLSSTSQQVLSNRIELPANVNVGEWLVENAKIGTQYFRTDGAVGQTNLPGGLNTWMWFSYDGNRYFARAWTADNGTTEFVLNNVNAVGGWKEISYTPIKSTPFSGTTNEYGNVVFTAVGNKIPVFAECSPYCGIPLRFNDNYWIHCIDPITNSNSIVANTVVNGTVYYVEL